LTLFSIAAAVVLTMLMTPAVAQTWDRAQTQVWNDVDKLWEAFSSGNADAVSKRLHDKYRGWSLQDPFPSTKEEGRKWTEMEVVASTGSLYSIKPIAIDIHGDVAVVFYSYRTTVKDEDGDTEIETGRWTDIYRKSGGDWLLIADYGGAMDDD